MGGSDGDSAGGIASAGGGASVTINVKFSNRSRFTVPTSLDATVGEFKLVLAEKCEVPADEQRLIYKGRILKDDQTLASYGVESDHTVHLVRCFVPSAAPVNTSAANLGASRSSDNTSETVRTTVSDETGGVGGSPLLGVGSNGLFGNVSAGLLGSGFPGFEQMQQQLTQNPNMMRELMNMPAVQNLMNNPDIMRNLIMNNPQMREIIDRNPELAHILNDPGTLRQTLEVARNPELMREMMRNTDRAMSNIESSPEGFNMLRRMYETVQEPFLNATTMAGDTGSNLGSNTFATVFGNQTAPQSTVPSQNLSGANSEAAIQSPVPNTNPLPNPWNHAASTISAPNSDSRTSGSVGLGMPELERMLGGTSGSSLMNQLTQNPMVTHLMQSIFSDPEISPPGLHALESNTPLRDMLSNPEILRQLASPGMLERLTAIEQSLRTVLGGQQSNRGQSQPLGGTGAQALAGIESLMNLFGVLAPGGPAVVNDPNVPPEELYATQLAQLQEMGFFDTQENIRALSATAGNVHAAVERLLGNLGQ